MPKFGIKIEEDDLIEAVDLAVDHSAPESIELSAWVDMDAKMTTSPEIPAKSEVVVSLDEKKKPQHTVITISSKTEKKKKEKKGIVSSILGEEKAKKKSAKPEKSVDDLIQDEMVQAILSRLPGEEVDAGVDVSVSAKVTAPKISIKYGSAVAEDEIEETVMMHEEAGVELEDSEEFFNKEDQAAKVKSEEQESLLLEKEGDAPAKTVVKMRMKERPSSWLGKQKGTEKSPLASSEDVSKKRLSRPRSQQVAVTTDEDPVTELFAKLMDLPDKKASPHGSKGSLVKTKPGSRPLSFRGSQVKLVMDSAIASAVAGGDEASLEARCMSADSALKPTIKKKRNEKDVERMLKEVERRMIATIHSDIDFEETEVLALESLLDEVSKYCSSYVENWSDTQGRRAATFTEANQELARSSSDAAHDSPKEKKRHSRGSPKMGKK